jgi:arylsulfatase A
MFREEWIPIVKKGEYTDFQLFDLETDPKQTKNLAAEKPELLTSLKKKLLEINASVMADGHDWHLK